MKTSTINCIETIRKINFYIPQITRTTYSRFLIGVELANSVGSIVEEEIGRSVHINVNMQVRIDISSTN